MGQAMIFLTVDRIAFGVDRLLEFMADRAAVEACRPPTPPGGARAIRTVARRGFPDGITFQLDICSRLPPTSEATGVDAVIDQLLATITAGLNPARTFTDLGIRLLWHFVELPPPELLATSAAGPSSELETFGEASQSWALRVDVCERGHPWIAPGRDPDLRKVRSILDRHPQPRLILPENDAASFRGDLIVLIALFAAKAWCLALRDDRLPTFFQGYCDQLFGRERERRKLSEAEWRGVVDRVFLRLYSGKVGMGFTMPVGAPSFRAYIFRALRGQAAGAASGSGRMPKPGRFPSSIQEAAAHLGVSHMTVRRWMIRLHFREWTEESWLAVSAKITPKKQWQELTAQLQKGGLRGDAARKRVQRCKRSGLTPNEARRQHASPQSRKGTCTACRDEQVLGELYQGKFYCAACFVEKTGITPTE
jgi:hypothetical protein